MSRRDDLCFENQTGQDAKTDVSDLADDLPAAARPDWLMNSDIQVMQKSPKLGRLITHG